MKNKKLKINQGFNRPSISAAEEIDIDAETYGSNGRYFHWITESNINHLRNGGILYVDDEEYEHYFKLQGEQDNNMDPEILEIKAWLHQKNTEHIQEVMCFSSNWPRCLIINEPKELRGIRFFGGDTQREFTAGGNSLFLHQTDANIFLRKKLQEKLDYEQYMVKFCGNQIKQTINDQEVHINNVERIEKILKEQPVEFLVKTN